MKLWKNYLRPAVTLMIICMLMGAALAAVNAATAPVIAANESASLNATYAAVLPEADGFEALNCSIEGVTAVLRAKNDLGDLVIGLPDDLVLPGLALGLCLAHNAVSAALGLLNDAGALGLGTLLGLRHGGGLLLLNAGHGCLVLLDQRLGLFFGLDGVGQHGVGLSLTLIQNLVDGLPEENTDSSAENKDIDDREDQVNINS